jgi:CTP:molybdopterin cytidylyltransferase MocA
VEEATFVHTAAVIFEGGASPQINLQATLQALRHAVTLDTLTKYLASGVDRVVLATNYPALAQSAAAMGVHIWDTAPDEPFHFGRTLQRLVVELGIDGVLYCSGGALPLITPAEIQWILDAMDGQAPRVIVNNLQSVDLVAWQPADYVQRIEPPAHDNFLGWLLREQGMERILIPNSAGIHFDLDTPTDFLMLGLSGLGGARTKVALATLPWSTDRLRLAADVLATDLPEVALIGRVGTPVMDHINRNLRVRLRVFSEERGLKALGREEAGLVVSLVADLLDDLGPERFFRYLESICTAVFFDTRVLFAHRGRRVSERDRYHSDLGQVEQIQDPWVRRFTVAALSCQVPVVLGGHSVVAGGLWLLADRAIAIRGGPALSQAKGFTKA